MIEYFIAFICFVLMFLFFFMEELPDAYGVLCLICGIIFTIVGSL